MRIELQSHSPSDTHELGVRIGKHLSVPSVLLLEGELGSGKTLLTKGVYLGLGGCDEEQVLSPSYTLVHHYDDARCPIFHVDLYRLEKPDAIYSLDFEEFLFQENGVTVLEWPRGAKDLLKPEEYLHIEFFPGENPENRKIVLSAPGQQYHKVLTEVRSSCSS